MSVHFEKKSQTSQEIPLASMPDIIFMLLIFFMVTTVLRETDVQVRTQLPEAEAIEKIEQRRLVSKLFIGPKKLEGGKIGETQVQIDDDLVPIPAIRKVMYAKRTEQPKLIVSMQIDDKTEMSVVTDVQQELREASALRISYASKRELPQ